MAHQGARVNTCDVASPPHPCISYPFTIGNETLYLLKTLNED